MRWWEILVDVKVLKIVEKRFGWRITRRCWLRPAYFPIREEPKLHQKLLRPTRHPGFQLEMIGPIVLTLLAILENDAGSAVLYPEVGAATGVEILIGQMSSVGWAYRRRLRFGAGLHPTPPGSGEILWR